MKYFSTFILALISAAVASPLERRQVQPVQRLDITGFTANCQASGGCSWTFNVVEFPNTATITCTGSVPTGTTFPATTSPFPCSDPAVLFQFQSVPVLSSYRLVLTDVHVAGCSRGGSRLMPAADFPVVTDGTGTHQTYVGATAFNIAATGACSQM
ncbi:hypothetical protein MCOR25_001950 [Pyricularia grisea]|nr:hypothetical protein MCOR25_001950 [Pyricularia grisea]